MVVRDDELILVYEGDFAGASLLRGLLEDADIEAFLRDEVTGALAPFAVSPGGVFAVKVVVRAGDLERARPIVEGFEWSSSSPIDGAAEGRIEASACPPAPCPFCSREAEVSPASEHAACPAWRCSCGAVGVGAAPCDLDEAADELLELLGLGGGTPFSVEPAGSSGFLSAGRFDAASAVDEVREELVASGYRVETRSLMVSNRDRTEAECKIIWARKTP
jgi:hypothetical protein